MAERRKGKKRKEDPGPGAKEEVEKPSKEEYAIANWLRSNVPTKKTKFLNHHVEYFLGAKAVDALLTSKWGTGDSPLFTERTNVSDYLHTMLVHKFFHRAKKVPVTEQELKGKSKKKDTDKEETKKKEEAANDSVAEGKDASGDQKEKEQKKKRKIRLDMHMEQMFVDGPEAYVWIYDPIPFYYWLFGALVVLGAIGICMFPLWPPGVRKGVYYLSVAAAGFLVLIIGLTTLRVIIFSVVWLCTLSRHHFWILPSLTEDVGFFASFWPLYQYEYRGPDAKKLKPDKGKKKKKDKCSDDEAANEEAEPLLTPQQSKSHKSNSRDSNDESDRGEKSDHSDRSPSAQDNTESESEGSQQSSTSKGFEKVSLQDVADS